MMAAATSSSGSHQSEGNASDIQSLRKWAAAERYLLTEHQLRIFYHSCYFNVERTKKCINVYFSIRSGTPELFANRDIRRPELQMALSALNYAVLPVCDPAGHTIMLHSLCNYEPSRYVFSDGIKLLLMMIDACVHSDGMSPGYVMLFDMKGVQSGHLTKLNISLLRKFFQYIQEGMPIRLHAIHIVNVVPIMGRIMSLTKPFMKKELLSLLHLHPAADGYDSLYEFIPRNCLPRDYGGVLDCVEDLHADHVKRLAALQSLFSKD
ncbi:alpha-tocopherol transfer protein-like isoform X1 [Schistocerca cancellata]|uniref:alpha-tocopherol transfer protein-like isoform X1 n=1 Tax=Schistocerca cancellata TaxID=274614 RepID=UPI0021179E95|nr:alpha-tocopherol transfer protein-like isoform X1 [Schistocerca cancellata]